MKMLETKRRKKILPDYFRGNIEKEAVVLLAPEKKCQLFTVLQCYCCYYIEYFKINCYFDSSQSVGLCIFNKKYRFQVYFSFPNCIFVSDICKLCGFWAFINFWIIMNMIMSHNWEINNKNDHQPIYGFFVVILHLMAEIRVFHRLYCRHNNWNWGLIFNILTL